MEETVEYLGLELRRMLNTRNINLGVISMVMLLKTLRTDGSNQRERIERVELSPEAIQQIDEEKPAKATEK